MSKIVYIDGVPEVVPDDVLLAGATEQGGNTDPATEPQPTTSTKPDDVDWDEWHRRSDAVRTVAREFDSPGEGDIREFLQGRTQRDLSDDEIRQFGHDVGAQRVSDIADIFDERLRSSTDRLKRARRTVRVQAPRGWLNRAFNSLDERAVGQVAARLLQRGHDPNDIAEKVISRVKDDDARQRLVDQLDAGDLKVEFSDGGYHHGQHVEFESITTPEEMMEFAQSMVGIVAKNIKIPDVHVEVPVNINGTRKVVKRNPETNLIEEIVEEPDASGD